MVSLMNLAEYGYRSAENIETAYIWFQFSGLWPIIPALMLHIALLSTGRSNFLKKIYAYPLIYFPAIVFIVSAVFTDLMMGPILKEYWGYAYAIADNPVFYLFALWTFITAFTAGLLALKKYRSSHGIERKQALFIFIGLFFPLILSLITDFFLQLFSQKVPELTQTTSALGLIFIAYGVWRYDFPQLTKSMAADKIISNMTNYLFMLDPFGKIINVNRSTINALGFSEESLMNKNFSDIFPHSLDYYLEKSSQENDENEMETSITTIKEIQIPILISLNPIKGFGDELLGYICIGTDVSKQIKFQEQLQESEFKFRSVLEQTSDGVALINQDMKVIYWNQAMEKITGISSQNAEDEYFYNIMWQLFMPNIKGRISLNQVKDVFLKAFAEKNIDHHLKFEELDINTPNGDNKSIATFNFFIKESPETLLCIVVRDITESKNAKDILESSLKEKEVLLREIHHRVKNNMQIVSSLLNLQSYSVEDENTHRLFKESQYRVKSMSMIHESLYQSTDLAHIDFEKYIKRLGSELLSSYGVDLDKIKFKTEVENIRMDINSAIPLGLILNELITNSLKYAFPHGEGVIKVKLVKDKNFYDLDVSDNGVGFPSEIDFRNTSTLGLELVNNLVGQLDGEIDLKKGRGTHFHIRFRKVHYEPRL